MAKTLTDNEKEVLRLLKSLRSSDEASYAKVWNQMMKYLGSSYTTVSEEVAKGMLIALATYRFGFDYRREITLLALGLIEGYDVINVTKRREDYTEHFTSQGNKLTADGIRKKEDIYLAEIIDELAKSIEERGDEYLEELFSFARNAYYIYFSQRHNAWQVRLPNLNEKKDHRRTGVGKHKIKITAMEEKIVDELHQRILNGEKVINTQYLLLTGDHYIGNLYYFKYHNHYDVMLLVNLDIYDEKSHIYIGIEKIVKDEILTILLPIDFEELQILVESYNRPLFNFNYEGDIEKDENQVFNYLKNKGVVFCPKAIPEKLKS